MEIPSSVLLTKAVMNCFPWNAELKRKDAELETTKRALYETVRMHDDLREWHTAEFAKLKDNYDQAVAGKAQLIEGKDALIDSLLTTIAWKEERIVDVEFDLAEFQSKHARVYSLKAIIFGGLHRKWRFYGVRTERFAASDRWREFWTEMFVGNELQAEYAQLMEELDPGADETVDVVAHFESLYDDLRREIPVVKEATQEGEVGLYCTGKNRVAKALVVLRLQRLGHLRGVFVQYDKKTLLGGNVLS